MPKPRQRLAPPLRELDGWPGSVVSLRRVAAILAFHETMQVTYVAHRICLDIEKQFGVGRWQVNRVDNIWLRVRIGQESGASLELAEAFGADSWKDRLLAFGPCADVGSGQVVDRGYR